MPRVYLSEDDLDRIRAHEIGKDVLRAHTLLREVQRIIEGLAARTTSNLRDKAMNEELSPENRLLVKNEVEILDHIAKILKAQHAMVEALSEPISAAKSRCKLTLRRYRCLISPWKLLPDEVWSEIFVASLEESPIKFPPRRRRKPLSEYNNTLRIPKETPWALLEVCSRWRHIALNESRLWDNFALEWRDDRLQDPDFVRHAQNVLQRNKRFTMALVHGYGFETSKMILPHHPTIANSIPFIREFVIPFSERLTSTTVSIFSQATMREIDRLVPDTFLPLLEEIAVQISDDNDGLLPVNIPFSLIDRFVGSSHLRRLEVNCAFTPHVVSSDHDPLPPSFPLNISVVWHGITYLILRGVGITPDIAYEILADRCPSLEEFKASIWPPAPVIIHSKTLMLPCLRKLDLADGFFSIIDHAQAARLNELSLECLDDHHNMPSDVEAEGIIAEFVQRSPNISLLSLDLTAITLDISQIVESCQNLVKLHVPEMDLPGSTMWFFTGIRWPQKLHCRIPLYDLGEFIMAIECYDDRLNENNVKEMPFEAFIRVVTQTMEEETAAYKATYWMNEKYEARLWDIDVMWVRTEVLEN